MEESSSSDLIEDLTSHLQIIALLPPSCFLIGMYPNYTDSDMVGCCNETGLLRIPHALLDEVSSVIATQTRNIEAAFHHIVERGNGVRDPAFDYCHHVRLLSSVRSRADKDDLISNMEARHHAFRTPRFSEPHDIVVDGSFPNSREAGMIRTIWK